MSKARKHVLQQVENDYPEPTEDQSIARVVETRGQNILEVMLPSGEKILTMIPTKYKKIVWFKRGDYVILERARQLSGSASTKVQSVIVFALFAMQIKSLKEEGKWPVFVDEQKAEEESQANKEDEAEVQDQDEEEEEEEEDDDDFDLPANPNHVRVTYDDSSSDEDDDD